MASYGVMLLLISASAGCAMQFRSFRNDPGGKTCKASDQIIMTPAHSKTRCAALCQNNDECNSIFYDQTNSMCYGCRGHAGNSTSFVIGGDVQIVTFVKVFQTCGDILDTKPYAQSGIFVNNQGVELLCDMETKGGGWTIFQRNYDYHFYSNTSTNFWREWKDYKHGFGDIYESFWFGLEKLAEILHTPTKQFELRIELERGKEKELIFAVYQNFSISGEEDKYRLHVGSFSGTAGDGLAIEGNQQMFSTWDSDNDARTDTNCADDMSAGWWFKTCPNSSPNSWPSIYPITWPACCSGEWISKTKMMTREIKM